METVKVFLVDDNLTFLRITTRFVAAEDWIEVQGSACSGEEAVRLAPSLQPDIILLDLNMPGLGGLGTIPLLRELVPSARIIALTLMDTDGYREAALEAGADRFVPKASMNQDLIPTILNAVLESAEEQATEADGLPPLDSQPEPRSSG